MGLHLFFKFCALEEMHVKQDDAFSIFYSQQPLSKLYAQLSLEANPPLYFTLLHFWIKLFGIGPFAVKSLSVLFSVSAGMVLFAIGRKHMNLLGGIVASLLFLFSNVHFDFAHEVRAFSLVMLLSSLSIYFFLNLLDKWSWKHLILLTFVNALLPYTHYTAVLLPVTEFIIAFFVLTKGIKQYLKLSLSFVLSALLFIPQLLKFKETIPDDTFWLSTPGLDDLEFVLIKLTGSDPSPGLITNTIYICLALTLLSFFAPIFKKRFDYRKMLLYIAVFFVPIYLNFLLAQYTPVFRLQYMLFAGLGPFLCIAYLISSLNFHRFIGIALAIFFIQDYGRSFNPNNTDIFRWDLAAKSVKANFNNEANYYIVPAWRKNDFSYYFDRDAFANYDSLGLLLNKKNIYPVYDAKGYLEYNPNDVVLILCNPQDTDPNETLKRKLGEEGYSLNKRVFESNEINIEQWQKD